MFGQLRADGSGRAVRFEREYATRPEDLWLACTDPERLARWLAAISGVFEAGGQLFIDYGDGEHNEIVIRRCDPPRSLDLDWSYGDQFTSTLRVEIEPSDGGATLILEHRGLPADQATGYSAGWHAFLDRLSDEVSGHEIGNWKERFDALIGDYQQPGRTHE
jgi:uncharacterized protein YndB with AHSA1/START domain